MVITQMMAEDIIEQETNLSKSLWYMGGLMTIHADKNKTNGQFALIEVQSGPGMEPPMHIHQNEDELFYILEGQVTAFRGSEVIEATPGSSVFLPRGIPHTFQIQSRTAKALILITPGGFENYFREIGRPAEQMTLPPSPVIPAPDRLVRTANKYGVTFVDV